MTVTWALLLKALLKSLPLLTFISFALSLFSASAAPTGCRSCRGNCSGNLPPLIENATESFRNATEGDYDDLMVSLADQDAKQRHKRASSVEWKPCNRKVQWELILIPSSIFIIPLALCGTLLCVCFCGPKETRGKLPEKMWGVKLCQKTQKRVRHDTEDELDYGDGYVQRKDSKKTRFNTNVLVIERRRESAITMGSSSPRPAPSPADSAKRTRFNKQVSVIEENEESVQTTRL